LARVIDDDPCVALKRLEEVTADRERTVEGFRASLAPLRSALARGPFLAGAAPRYADYCAFGGFMWARCVGGFEPLEPGDPLCDWRDRLLDAFEGLARSAPRARKAAAE